MSTTGLADLYGVDGKARDELLRMVRSGSVTLHAPGLPPVIVRDQKPMKFIDRKIEDGSSLPEFLEAINSRVFFWASRDRLDRLLNAREYVGNPHVILHVDTAALVEKYGNRLELCRFNSGAVTQMNHPARGHNSWLALSAYPYEQNRRNYGPSNALAEVTVRGDVPDVLSLTRTVERT